MSSSASPPARKKRQPSQSSDDAKKLRGRPRVEPEDETAQDRRRTQIRLAQRAYRQRKETTISSLKKETAELQRFIKQMNTDIKLMKDTALNEGVSSTHPDLAQRLSDAAQRLAKMSKRTNDVDEELLEDDEPDRNDVFHRISVDEYTEAKPRKRARQSDPLPTPTSTDRGSDPGIGLGYKLLINHLDSLPPDNEEVTSENQVSLWSGRSSSSVENNSTSGPSLSWLESLQQGTRTKSTLHISSEPKAPFTFSFQETTFARRLHRATLERGFRFISHPSLRPEVFRRKFKLSLMYGSLDEIREKIKGLLLRSATDSLEWTDHPFLHIGGAGTHYPRRDEHGNPIPKPNSYLVRSIGPQKLARLIKDPDSGSGKDIIIDIDGFEGEWLDAHDVEGYLREKGIEIGGQADFAEGDVIKDATVAVNSAEASSGTSGSNGLPALEPFFPRGERSFESPDMLTIDNFDMDLEGSHNIPASAHGPESIAIPGPVTTSTSIDWTTKDTLPLQQQPDMWDWGGDSLFDLNSGNANANNNSNGDNALALSSFGAGQPDFGIGAALGPFANKRYIEKTHVTLDVEKLVTELSKRAVCLGRSPGFRRYDVDRAFNMAIVAF